MSPLRNQQATEWFLRIQDENATEEDFRAWQQWLAESPEHRRAFQKVEDIWQGLGESSARPWPSVRELNDDEYDGRMPVDKWLGARRRVRPILPLAVAASVLIAFIGYLQADNIRAFLGRSSEMQVATFTTTRAEDRELSLLDGTRLTVGARTRISVRLTNAERNVTIDSGEAFFKVAHDPHRPFVVHAGNGTITAIGTAFNVSHLADRTVITVTEGQVKVAPAAPPDTQSDAGTLQSTGILLAAGQQLTYGAETRVSPVAADPAIATAWRNGHLKYLNEPLKYVIHDVARYSQQQITIDTDIGELRYTGTVLPNDIEDWLTSLTSTFPVDISRMPDGSVRLRSRP